MIIALRIFTIVIGSALLGAGYIELYKPELDWVPSEKQRKREEIIREDLDVVKKQYEQIIKEAGIELEQFQSLLQAGALVIDGHTAEEFEEGHLDTRYIVNVTPEDMTEQVFMLEGLFFTDPPVPIVLYCRSRDCDDSKTSYVTMRNNFGELLNQGAVKIYLEGWEGIQKHKLPTIGGPSEPLDIMINLVLNEQQMFGQPGMEMPADPNMLSAPAVIAESNMPVESNITVEPNTTHDPNQAFDPNLAIDPNIAGAAL